MNEDIKDILKWQSLVEEKELEEKELEEKRLEEKKKKKKKEEKSVNYKIVLSAAKKAADTIHGEADMKIVRGIVGKAVKIGKDTEDAIQIAVNMLR